MCLYSSIKLLACMETIMNGVSGNLSPTGAAGASPAEGTSFSGTPPASSGEAIAQQEIASLAAAPDNTALKMNLAQQGISLTDNSDVGAGERFESFSDKLSYIRDAKAKLIVAMIMSMVSSGGSGPSGGEEINQAREAFKGGKAP